MTIIQMLGVMLPLRRVRLIDREISHQRKRIEKAFAEFEKSKRAKDASHSQLLEAVEYNSITQCEILDVSQKYIEKKKKESGEHGAVQGGS
jgi:hypothetical protein